jgi:hypothetical protein
MTFVITGAKILNGKTLERKLVAAFDTWARKDINGTSRNGEDSYWYDQFQDMSKWDYGRETTRKNRDVVESPRDIYDLGELFRSGRKTFDVVIGSSTVEASWNWNATGSSGYHYAHDVHEGQGTSGGWPRRWTEEIAMPLKFQSSILKQALMARVKEQSGL